MGPRHRFRITVAAAVLVPMSTVLSVSSSAPLSQPVADHPIHPTHQAATASTGQPTRPDIVPASHKIAPPGYGGPRGSATVITETVAQRVAAASTITNLDLPTVALAAYRHAAASVGTTDPGCHLGWPVLAAIGQVESDQGRYGGSVVLTDGEVQPVILGPVLDGAGHVGAIADTDNGRYDGNTIWDRAVGPMQFIPSTWAIAGADGNADGVRDPNNFFDAALAAARYLCAAGTDMREPAQARAAILRYNHSEQYVDVVLALARAYTRGDATVVEVGSGTATSAAAAVHRRTNNRQHQGQQPPVHRQPHRPPGHHPGQKPPHQKPPHHEPPTQPPAPALPVLQPCQSGWCLDDNPLNLGTEPDLSVVQGDYNLDGTAQPVQDELTSMSGLEVQLTVLVDTPITGPPAGEDPPSPGDPPTAGDGPTPPSAAPGTAAPPTDSPPCVPPPAESPDMTDEGSTGDNASDPTGTAAPCSGQPVQVVSIMVDADGLVRAINGLPYVPQPLSGTATPTPSQHTGR